HLATLRCPAFALRSFNAYGLGTIAGLPHLADSHGPFFAGPQPPVQDLLTIQFLATAILLHHHVGDLINACVSGETLLAFQALAASTDGIRLLTFPRIHYFIVGKTAKRTLHVALGRAPRP